jgi:hypothetical protein
LLAIFAATAHYLLSKARFDCNLHPDVNVAGLLKEEGVTSPREYLGPAAIEQSGWHFSTISFGRAASSGSGTNDGTLHTNLPMLACYVLQLLQGNAPQRLAFSPLAVEKKRDSLV